MKRSWFGISLIVLFSLLSLIETVWGATRNVPGTYATIQAAINAASAGDTVLVAAGTYTGAGNRALDTLGKAIIVTSAGGPSTCIIDCNTEGRGFNVNSGEGSNTVIQGFTIKNGWDMAAGAGIYCNGTSPTIRNCIIRENYARNTGGGGIYCTDASPTVVDCSLISNTADTKGAGMSCESNCNPVIDHCLFQGNQVLGTSGTGGGLRCENYCPPVVYNCTFTGNSAGFGGAMYVRGYSHAAITNCLFYGNTVASSGGGRGGAVFCENTSPSTFQNCTFNANTADQYGGALYCNNSSPPTITDSVMWGDSPAEMYTWVLSTPIVTYSDFQGGITGTGNINLNPLFATGPLGSYYLSYIAAGQGSNSPCKDTGHDLGSNICFPASHLYCMNQFTPRTDQALDAGPVDMGFHYFQSTFATPTPTPWQPPVPANSTAGMAILVVVFCILLAARKW